MRTDGGMEFMGEFKERGIRHETTAPYSPSQNGISERANRTVFDHARAMMHDGGVPTNLWAEAVATAVQLNNIVPHRRHPHTTPFEIIFNRRPHVEHLRAYGSIAYAKIPDELRKKLDPKMVKCILVGYRSRDCYRLYCPSQHKIVESRDVVFDEGLGQWSRPTTVPSSSVDSEPVPATVYPAAQAPTVGAQVPKAESDSEVEVEDLVADTLLSTHQMM